MKTIQIIERRLKEHKEEVALIDEELTKYKSSITTPNIEVLQHLSILKDRLLFNKACATLLEDLKKEIEDANA